MFPYRLRIMNSQVVTNFAARRLQGAQLIQRIALTETTTFSCNLFTYRLPKNSTFRDEVRIWNFANIRLNLPLRRGVHRSTTSSPLLADFTMPAIPSTNATLFSDTINDYKQQTADVLSSHAASTWNSTKHFGKSQNTFLFGRPRQIIKY